MRCMGRYLVGKWTCFQKQFSRFHCSRHVGRGHLTHRTSTRLTMPSGQSCSSVCIRPESMTSTSCDSVLSPCVVNWTARCRWRHWSVATLSVSLCRRQRRTYWTKPRPINFFWEFYVGILMVLCKHFSAHVKKRCFLILHGSVLTHALWSETF